MSPVCQRDVLPLSKTSTTPFGLLMVFALVWRQQDATGHRTTRVDGKGLHGSQLRIQAGLLRLIELGKESVCFSRTTTSPYDVPMSKRFPRWRKTLQKLHVCCISLQFLPLWIIQAEITAHTLQRMILVGHGKKSDEGSGVKKASLREKFKTYLQLL